MQKIIEFEIAMRLISEANTGFSFKNQAAIWGMKKKRKEEQKNAICKYWLAYGKIVHLPCTIKLTRIAPRSLDDDNLAYAFKHIRDIVSDLIKPGMAKGRADAKDITFLYAQAKGQPKQYAIKIEIYV